MLLNNAQLPDPLPVLDGFFSQNSRLHGFVRFIPHQGMNVVFTGETFNLIILVRPDPLDKVGCDTSKNGSVLLTGQ